MYGHPFTTKPNAKIEQIGIPFRRLGGHHGVNPFFVGLPGWTCQTLMLEIACATRKQRQIPGQVESPTRQKV